MDSPVEQIDEYESLKKNTVRYRKIKKLMKDIYSSENRFANMVGESSYNEYAKKPDRSGKRR